MHQSTLYAKSAHRLHALITDPTRFSFPVWSTASLEDEWKESVRSQEKGAVLPRSCRSDPACHHLTDFSLNDGVVALFARENFLTHRLCHACLGLNEYFGKVSR
jgi:hypothetical protein